MHYVRSFFAAIGMFWAITIISLVTVGVVVGGLTVGGYLFASKVVAPLSKNLHEQQVNNDYQVTQHSQAYQDTFQSQTDKAYQQLVADKYTLASDKNSGASSDVIQGDYAMTANDIHMFCVSAQKLLPSTLDSLGPNEVRFYQSNC